MAVVRSLGLPMKRQRDYTANFSNNTQLEVRVSVRSRSISKAVLRKIVAVRR